MYPISPLFSVIIPLTDETFYPLPFTLDSIVQQVFESYEIILVDGRKKDLDTQVFTVYRPHISHILPSLDHCLFAMMNAGASVARGEYLHFLKPGEFYISRHAFTFMKQFIEEQPLPDLVYTGCLIKHSLAPTQTVFKLIEVEDLKGARIPMSLQAYWFNRNSFLHMKKFDVRFEVQAGFDLICRIYCSSSLRKAMMKRILTDYEYRLSPPFHILRQIVETLIILFFYFGWGKAVWWWLAQNQMRFLHWWMKSIQAAVWKRKSENRV